MSRKLPGKQYEQIVADIHRQFSDAANITLNEKIIGKSGTLRQIDVALRSSVVGYPVLIVIECKDYKRKVDVGRVDELAGKIDDVTAQGGVLISDSGFTSGAIARAKNHGRIQLCSVLDSSNGKLRSKLHIPLKVSFSNLQWPYSVTLLFSRPAEAITAAVLPFTVANSADRKEMYDFILEKGADFIGAFHRWTAKESADLPTGDHIYERTLEETPQRTIKLRCLFSKTLRAFINDNIYANAIGIYDHVSGSIVKGEIRGTELVEEQIVQTWREVEPNFKVQKGTVCYRRVSSYSEDNVGLVVEELLRGVAS